jgi:hypothetical protein
VIVHQLCTNCAPRFGPDALAFLSYPSCVVSKNLPPTAGSILSASASAHWLQRSNSSFEQAALSVCVARIASTYFLIAPACWNAAALLSRRVDAGLFEPLPSLPFRPLRLALPFPLFLFEFGFALLHTPFITLYGAFAVLQLRAQDDLGRNLRNARFNLALFIILPGNADVFRAGALEN